MTNADKKHDESLIERAARVYDFGAHLRRRDAPDTAQVSAPEIAESAPVVQALAYAPEQQIDGMAADTAPVPPAKDFGRTESEAAADDPAFDLIAAAPPAPEGAETLSREAAATLMAIPSELRAGAEPEEDPVLFLDGIAHVDRAMLAEKGMLVPGAPIGALAEEFRLVKRQLLLGARALASGPAGERSRTILVGSAKPGEGKTFCAINLAISLAAERDVEVLLIDGDFAKPNVMATLGLDDSTGFLDILADRSLDPEQFVVRTDVPQLSLLPAGKRSHSDTELLASARTREVVERLLANDPRRIIVFDTPPALAASPASVLALLVGQVMLVVRADRTTEAEIREAVNLLDGCEQISLVLNSRSYEPGRGRFGSYYG
ncbi:exopolysaccharide/PEP-CTERM locus tyrosine autokinase [Sphingomonas sp. OV641]|uniref:AAA family ATPase n=1 Tax=Sphingomonas sp. OV641 TaxID=1881068 RepID=UPI0008CA40FE|nr:AAA family ATPase [Sphingomonas sp. OV641]SEJ24382.1 exopolysaccharide/PEP-CTERM locus tyrosine autokinase [Sphingomonas sp. OV641]